MPADTLEQFQNTTLSSEGRSDMLGRRCRASWRITREIVEQVNKRKSEIPLKFPNIPEYAAGIFVQQLAILE